MPSKCSGAGAGLGPAERLCWSPSNPAGERGAPAAAVDLVERGPWEGSKKEEEADWQEEEGRLRPGDVRWSKRLAGVCSIANYPGEEWGRIRERGFFWSLFYCFFHCRPARRRKREEREWGGGRDEAFLLFFLLLLWASQTKGRERVSQVSFTSFPLLEQAGWRKSLTGLSIFFSGEKLEGEGK